MAASDRRISASRWIGQNGLIFRKNASLALHLPLKIFLNGMHYSRHDPSLDGRGSILGPLGLHEREDDILQVG